MHRLKGTNMWGVVAAIVGGIFSLTTALLKSRSEPRLYRLLARQAALLEKVPEGSAAAQHLLELVDHTASDLKAREIARASRKLNGGNVAAVIFIGVAGGLAGYGLWLWAVVAFGTVWYWFAVAALLILAFFVVGLVSVGVSSIYAPPKTKAAPKS